MDERQRIGHYLDLLNEIKQQGVEESTAVRIVQEVARDRRSEQIREERRNGVASNGSVNTGNGEPATDKQLGYLSTLGVKVPDGLTKKEASALIDAAVGNEE